MFGNFTLYNCVGGLRCVSMFRCKVVNKVRIIGIHSSSVSNSKTYLVHKQWNTFSFSLFARLLGFREHQLNTKWFFLGRPKSNNIRINTYPDIFLVSPAPRIFCFNTVFCWVKSQKLQSRHWTIIKSRHSQLGTQVKNITFSNFSETKLKVKVILPKLSLDAFSFCQ